MTTIYLSSTYEDLKDYRSAVFEALRKAGYEVKAMEDYVATERRPVEKCLADVAEADIYVGLFAFRYGYVPPPEHGNPDGLSITELELRHAEKLGKPCLAFVVSEDTPWPPRFIDGLKGERINRLREDLLTEKIASFFSSPHQLASLVQAAVTKQLEKSKEVKTPGSKESAPPPAITWDIEKNGSPYPGLMHFTRKYAPVFFGREAEVREILDRMTVPEGRFIIVSGGSGTGKSSLVNAGILPRLEQAGLPGVGTCFCVRMLPSGGADPFDALTHALHLQAEQAGINSHNLAEELSAQPRRAGQRLQTLIANGTNADALVLFLDQMEELFTAQTKDRSKPFLSALYSTVNEASLRVIATIRSDFLHHCHEHPEMLKVLRGDGHYPLGRVEHFMMRDIIVKPAACAGLTIPDKLVRRIIEGTGAEPGNLPLLAFVLRRLFDKRSDNTLREEVYDALGGVAGAIRDHVRTVEETIARAVGSDPLDLLPKIFQSLLVLNVDGQPTRRRIPIAQFSQDLRVIIDILVNHRLLSTEVEGETSTASVAHEKLFEAWPALAHWIGENRDDLFVLRLAETEAREYVNRGYDLRYLWHPDRLKRLQEIIQRLGGDDLDSAVRQYSSPQLKLIEPLKTSISHQERQTIGSYLAALGDPRPGVGLAADGVPDIEWVDIPGGWVQLEEVEGVFKVKRFRIARYPVTNIQFEAFVNAQDGYSNEQWWNGIERRQEPSPPIWKDQNLPRANVSLYEAVAFCRWLTQKYRGNRLLEKDQEIRLPSEWEWQQAATGGHPKNIYPWGRDWDAARANNDESGLGRPTAVGLYPNGATLQGVLDMAGNVFEWCFNHRTGSGIEIDMSGEVIRGGSWSDSQRSLRSSHRSGNAPGDPRFNIGFRVAQDLS